MKKLRYITDFLKLNGKYILLFLPIVLHQTKILDPKILSTLCLIIVLWCAHRYVFTVYKHENKKIDYVFFGALTFYLTYMEFGFFIFSIFVSLHFIYQKARLKKWGPLGLYWLGAAVPIGLCLHHLPKATEFLQNLFDYYLSIVPLSHTGFMWIFLGIIFLKGLLNRFYVVMALVYLSMGFATEKHNFIIASVLIGLLSFTALWRIEKRIT